MFEKKSTNDKSNKTDDSLSVLRPSKGSAKVVIGHGVKIKVKLLMPIMFKLMAMLKLL